MRLPLLLSLWWVILFGVFSHSVWAVETPANRSALSKIEAESWLYQQWTQSFPSALGWVVVGYLDRGDWMQYRALDFGTKGANAITIRYGTPEKYAWKTMSIRLGSKDGQEAGRITFQATSNISPFAKPHWEIYKETAFPLSRTVTGVQDVFFVFEWDASANIDWFQFAFTDKNLASPGSSAATTVNNTTPRSVKIAASSNLTAKPGDTIYTNFTFYANSLSENYNIAVHFDNPATGFRPQNIDIQATEMSTPTKLWKWKTTLQYSYKIPEKTPNGTYDINVWLFKSQGSQYRGAGDFGDSVTAITPASPSFDGKIKVGTLTVSSSATSSSTSGNNTAIVRDTASTTTQWSTVNTNGWGYTTTSSSVNGSTSTTAATISSKSVTPLVTMAITPGLEWYANYAELLNTLLDLELKIISLNLQLQNFTGTPTPYIANITGNTTTNTTNTPTSINTPVVNNTTLAFTTKTVSQSITYNTLCADPTVWAPPYTPRANKRYLRDSGSDNNDGLTPATAWRSLPPHIASLPENTEIIFSDATYKIPTGQDLIWWGTDKPTLPSHITIRSERGILGTKITADRSDGGSLLTLYYPSTPRTDIEVYGLDVGYVGSGDGTISVQWDWSDIRIIGNRFTDTGGGNNSQDHVLYLAEWMSYATAPRNFKIQWNKITDFGNNGGAIKIGAGTYLDRPIIHDLDIQYNCVETSGWGPLLVSGHYVAWENANTLVANNVFKGTAVDLRDDAQGTPAKSNYGGTVYFTWNYGGRWGTDPSFVLRDNVIQNIKSDAIQSNWHVIYNVDQPNYHRPTISWNIIYNFTNPDKTLYMADGLSTISSTIPDTVIGTFSKTVNTPVTTTNTTNTVTIPLTTISTKTLTNTVSSASPAVIDDIIADIKEAPTGFGRHGYGRPENYPSVRFTGNFDQALALDQRYKPYENYVQNANNLTSWCWVYMDPDNTAQNVAVEVRNHEIYILRKSTNKWELVDGGRPSGFRWDYNSARDDIGLEYNNQDIVDNNTVRVYPGSPPRTDLISHELWTPNAAGNRPDMYDTKAIYATCEARIVPFNGNDGSNLATAKFSGEVGFDYWHRWGPGFIRNVGFWDGSTGRMERIGTDWTRLNYISLKPTDKRNSTFDSVYTGLGGWPTIDDDLLEPPYTLTEAEIRANPPPVTTSGTPTATVTKAVASAPSGRDAFTAWNAWDYNEMNGIRIEGDHIGYTAPGDWIKYSGVNFWKTIANSFAMEIALPDAEAGWVIQIRADSPTGTILRSFNPTPTGGWFAFKTQVVDIQPITGVRDIYITFGGTKADIANIRGIIFSADVVTYTPPTTTKSVTTVPPTWGVSLLKATGTTRILPLGDSMTAGNDSFRAYRSRLKDLLYSKSVEFVGTQQSSDGLHDGYGGIWIGPGGNDYNLYDRLPGIISGTNPDIIIAAFGWNSVYQEPDQAGPKYEWFIRRLQELAPNAKIITATLSPQRGETEAQSNNMGSYKALNDAARRLANASATDNIYLADFAIGGFVYDDYWDVIHWLQPGADKAAQILYNVIVGGGTSSNTVTKTVTTISTPLTKSVTSTPASSSAKIQEAVDDMKLWNSYPIAIIGSNGQIIERPPGGYPARHGAIVMGNLAHGSAAPSFWSPSPGYEYIRNQDWPTLVPWIVLLTGTNNQAIDTRVEFRNIQSYVLRKSTWQWEQVSNLGTIDGYNCPPGKWDNCSEPTDIYTSNGVTSLKPSRTGSNFHGWSTAGWRMTNPYDVEIYYSTLEARLVWSDAGSAQYMLHIGTDYYPDGIQVAQMSGYNPWSGYSRTKAITTEWNSFSYTTIDPGYPDNDGNGESYIFNRSYAAPEQTFRNNPPPPLR